jgi:hypothetical protein
LVQSVDAARGGSRTTLSIQLAGRSCIVCCLFGFKLFGFGLKFFCLRRRFLKLLSRVSSLVFGVFWMYWGVVGAATRDRQVVIKTQETRHA